MLSNLTQHPRVRFLSSDEPSSDEPSSDEPSSDEPSSDEPSSDEFAIECEVTCNGMQ